MKRLLAMIMAFFFALNNNVSFQASGNDVYSPESFYRIEGNEEPDYRYIYENYTSIQSGGKCIGSSIDLSRMSVRIRYSDTSAALYWWDTSVDDDSSLQSSDIDAMGDTYEFTTHTNIVAPRDCKVVSKSSGNTGHSMELVTTDGKYKIVISGMERWFCCRQRNVDGDSDPMDTQWKHTANIEGYIIRGGYMIGIANEGTRVTVASADNSSPSTMAGFFSQ